MKKIRKAIHPDDDLHYEKMGLDRKKVENSELRLLVLCDCIIVDLDKTVVDSVP